MKTETPIGTPMCRSSAIARGFRRLEMREQRKLAVVTPRRDVGEERERLDPQHARGRDAAAERTERRQAEPAVHQHVADRPEQREAEQAEIHRRPREAEAFAQAAQREEQRSAGAPNEIACRKRVTSGTSAASTPIAATSSGPPK